MKYPVKPEEPEMMDDIKSQKNTYKASEERDP